MIICFLYCILALYVPVNTALHDFHVSRCEINYVTKSGDLQISAHIFIDDLEKTLQLSGQNHLYILTNKESKDADSAILKYIQSKLTIQSGNQILRLKYVGKEASDDNMAVWCYFEVSNVNNIKSLQITNTILLELFDDQKNIIDFTIDNKKKNFTILDTKNNTITFKW